MFRLELKRSTVNIGLSVAAAGKPLALPTWLSGDTRKEI